MLLKGLYTAIITPFNMHNQLDEEGLRQNLRFQIQQGVNGIVVLGTTGEDPTLTPQEKERVIQIGAEEIKGKAHFIVGTGSYSTEQTIKNTRLAAKLGAEAALVVTPYYNKPTQEGLYLHFKTLSEATPLPICVYNIQGRTGQNLHTETLKRLFALPNIVAVKEASGNISQMSDVMEAVSRHRPDFSVLSGDDALTLPLMALGGHGIISVVGNLVPGAMQDLVQACLSSDFKKAQRVHYQLLPLFKGCFLETNPIPIKTAMQMCGLPSGPCRLPLCHLTNENVHQLHTILQNLPPKWLPQYG